MAFRNVWVWRTLVLRMMLLVAPEMLRARFVNKMIGKCDPFGLVGCRAACNPVGPREDALLSIAMLCVSILLTHLPIYLMAPSAWRVYISSNQYLVGGLLYMWLTGYMIISFVIYHQFERTERYPADDYYIMSEGSGAAMPELLVLPDGRLAVGACIGTIKT
ncbi:hypothetical protein PSACC_02275 [Paramicrosporidium saccamoebae]|uniref:Uncharacterized protein n=1 Tax=Paramicrosporidium saccamoebae TaxID=1246581 RepID=A0A2H9TJQ0_9FUNG|nr:hypothetical protein PSACC_02275 [Paramicrosporidium saccamoebae]